MKRALLATAISQKIIPRFILIPMIEELRGEGRKTYDQHGEHLLHHAANVIEHLMEHITWPTE